MNSRCLNSEAGIQRREVLTPSREAETSSGKSGRGMASGSHRRETVPLLCAPCPPIDVYRCISTALHRSVARPLASSCPILLWQKGTSGLVGH